MSTSTRTPTARTDSSDARTDAQLPLPIILVIGEFSDAAGASSVFGTHVWNGIQRQYARETHRKQDALYAHDTKQLLDQMKRVNAYVAVLEYVQQHLLYSSLYATDRLPVPLQLHVGEGDDVDEFAQSVRLLLSVFDVWGIVVTCGAQLVTRLKEKLSELNLVRISTTESTALEGDSTDPLELRLMANNREQARSLLIAAFSRGPRNCPIRYTLDDDRSAVTYASNLEHCLKGEAKAYGMVLEKARSFDSGGNPVKLIVIGYERYCISVMNSCRASSMLFCSDGSISKKVAGFALGKGMDHWEVAFPSASFESIGMRSYSAFAEAGQILLRYWKGNKTTRFSLRRKSYLELVKERLESYDPQTFRFEANQNTAIRFEVKPFEEVVRFLES